MTTVAVLGDDILTLRRMRDLADDGQEVVWVTAKETREMAGIRMLNAAPDDPDQIAEQLSGATLCYVASDEPETIALAQQASSMAGATLLVGSQRAETLERIQPKGRTVFGVRWVPAVTSVLAHLAAQGKPTWVRVAWVTPLSGPAADRHLYDLLSAISSGPMFEAGQWRRVGGPVVSEDVFLPEPFGWRELLRCAGAESVVLPKSLGVSDQVTVLCGASERVGPLLKLLARSRDLDPSSMRARVGALLATSIPRASQRAVAQAGWCALRVDVSMDDGSFTSYGVLDDHAHLDSATLAATVACLPERIPAGEVTSVAELVDPEAFVKALAARGVRVARLSR